MGTNLLIGILGLVFNGAEYSETTIYSDFDYDKLLTEMRFEESRYDQTKQCQIWAGGTYGMYQMDPAFGRVLGYTFPQPCEKHHEIALKGFHYLLDLMDKNFGGRDKWEFKTIRGIRLTQHNVLQAMWGAPYGTIQYLNTGINWGNGYWTVKSLLQQYEHRNDFYKQKKVYYIKQIDRRKYIEDKLREIEAGFNYFKEFIHRYGDERTKLVTQQSPINNNRNI